MERVGLILNDGRVIELKNVAADPAKTFSVSPADMMQYEDEAIASWHTHPVTEADLSTEDYQAFLNWPDLLHLILGTDGLRGYVVARGTVLNDASKNHSAWQFAQGVIDLAV